MFNYEELVQRLGNDGVPITEVIPGAGKGYGHGNVILPFRVALQEVIINEKIEAVCLQPQFYVCEEHKGVEREYYRNHGKGEICADTDGAVARARGMYFDRPALMPQHYLDRLEDACCACA